MAEISLAIPEPPVGATVRFQRGRGGHFQADRHAANGLDLNDVVKAWRLIGTWDLNAEWVSWDDILQIVNPTTLEVAVFMPYDQHALLLSQVEKG